MEKLIDVLKQIIDYAGTSALEDPEKVERLFKDLANNVGKKHKKAIITCIEQGFVIKLNNVSNPEDRAACKKQLAESLHEEEGLDLNLCNAYLSILGAVLFGDKFESIPNKADNESETNIDMQPNKVELINVFAQNPLKEIDNNNAEKSENKFDALIKAAEQGDTIAQCNLGYFYYNGEGVPKDINKAVYWHTKAAEQGLARSQNDLGCFYQNGEGVPKDLNKAVYWITKAADQGLAQAQCNLGYCYDAGVGVSKDMYKAAHWFAKAANQGNLIAQNNLGYCYQHGEGVPKDLNKAVYWYTKVAEQGDATSQCNLGYFYHNGEGVPKDLEKAAYWYSKAAEQGDVNAQNILKEINNSVTNTQQNNTVHYSPQKRKINFLAERIFLIIGGSLLAIAGVLFLANNLIVINSAEQEAYTKAIRILTIVLPSCLLASGIIGILSGIINNSVLLNLNNYIGIKLSVLFILMQASAEAVKSITRIPFYDNLQTLLPFNLNITGNNYMIYILALAFFIHIYLTGIEAIENDGWNAFIITRSVTRILFIVVLGIFHTYMFFDAAEGKSVFVFASCICWLMILFQYIRGRKGNRSPLFITIRTLIFIPVLLLFLLLMIWFGFIINWFGNLTVFIPIVGITVMLICLRFPMDDDGMVSIISRSDGTHIYKNKEEKYDYQINKKTGIVSITYRGD